MLLKQNTAVTVTVGPVLDSAGAAKTDEVVGNIRLSKAGGAAAAPNASATLTHSHTGKYLLALTTSDVNTLAGLEVSLNSGTNDMPVARFNVVTANVWDSLVGGTDKLDVNLEEWKGSAAPANTGDAYARLGAPAGASIAADIATVDGVADAIKAKTDNLPASPAAVGSAMTLTSGERTAIANEVESQIIDEADAEKVLVAITSKIAEANPDLNGLTLGAIAQQVRTELATELARIDAAISSRLASSGYTAPDNASVTAIKAKTDQLNFTGTDVKSTLDGEEVTPTTASKAGYALSATGADLVLVDGLALTRAIKAILAVLTGVTNLPDADTVEYKARDGATTDVTIDYGATAGQRTASTFAA